MSTFKTVEGNVHSLPGGTHDKFNLLPIPQVGRTIKVTLRDSGEFEAHVTEVSKRETYIAINLDDALSAHYAIVTSPDVAEDPCDIVAWEYVDEAGPEALPTPEVGRNIKATLWEGREVTGEVTGVSDRESFVAVALDHALLANYFIHTPRRGAQDPGDVLTWEYTDEPA